MKRRRFIVCRSPSFLPPYSLTSMVGRPGGLRLGLVRGRHGRAFCRARPGRQRSGRGRGAAARGDGAPRFSVPRGIPGLVGSRRGPSWAPARPGDSIGRRYRILDTLGQGGMGTVHLAKDRLDGLVALKRLGHAAVEPEPSSRSPRRRARPRALAASGGAAASPPDAPTRRLQRAHRSRSSRPPPSARRPRSDVGRHGRRGARRARARPSSARRDLVAPSCRTTGAAADATTWRRSCASPWRASSACSRRCATPTSSASSTTASTTTSRPTSPWSCSRAPRPS